MVYAYLLANGTKFDSGSLGGTRETTVGAGPLKLPPLGGQSASMTTTVSVAPFQQVDVPLPFSVNGANTTLDAAIRWPEPATPATAHNAMQLLLVDPVGGIQETSGFANDVWQKVHRSGALRAGTWKLRVVNTGRPGNTTQTVSVAAVQRF